jgi:hypothetical protein
MVDNFNQMALLIARNDFFNDPMKRWDCVMSLSYDLLQGHKYKHKGILSV